MLTRRAKAYSSYGSVV